MLWFEEHKEEHEKALARVKNIVVGCTFPDAVKFGYVYVMQYGEDFYIRFDAVGLIMVRQAQSLSNDLKAASAYIINFKML